MNVEVAATRPVVFKNSRREVLPSATLPMIDLLPLTPVKIRMACPFDGPLPALGYPWPYYPLCHDVHNLFRVVRRHGATSGIFCRGAGTLALQRPHLPCGFPRAIIAKLRRLRLTLPPGTPDDFAFTLRGRLYRVAGPCYTVRSAKRRQRTNSSHRYVL